MVKLTKSQKEHIRSAVNTFVSAFVVTITPFITTMDWRHVEQSAVISIAAVGVRAGIKALIAYLFPQE